MPNRTTNKNASEHDWFEHWFDSPYYHLLYRNRDFKEAENFIQNIVERLQIKQGAKVLDVACGRGRHSIFLNKLGLEVDGIDLSDESIRHALQFENDSLHFYKHDMRHPFRIERYDVVMNLFTSFGYFDRRTEHEEALAAIRENMVPDGRLVLDFFNASKISASLPVEEVLDREGVKFHIHKHSTDNNIVKDINFSAEGKEFSFTEKVKAFTLEDFEGFFDSVGLKIEHKFGDYELNEFDVATSDRLILVAKKIFE